MSVCAETTIGEVLTLEYGKALPERVRDGEGSPVFGSNGEVGRHSEPLVRGPGVVIGRKGTAGSVTYVPVDFFPIDTTYYVRIKDDRLSSMKYAALLLEASDLPSVCAQTGVPGLNRDRAYELTVRLPSATQQGRIVDLLGRIERLIQAAETELSAARHALDLMIGERLSAMPTVKTLAEVATTRSGPSYAATAVSNEPKPGSVPVIGIPNTKQDGSIDLTGVGFVSGLPSSVGQVDESSLILIRTNGNRQRIGNVYRPGTDAHGHAVSAFQFLMSAHNPDDRDYLYWVLREPGMQRAMTEAASGTTGLGNLAVRWLNSSRIYWSDDSTVRRGAVAPLEAQLHVVEALKDESQSLVVLRSRMLSALFKGRLEIAETYDMLFDEVA